MKHVLLALLGLAACTSDAPQTPIQQALDPNDGPVDARMEGVWERADGVALLLNEFGSLRVEGVPGVEGQRWDYHGDTLTLYLQPGGDGVVTPQDYRVMALSPDSLRLVPQAPLGGSFARRVPVP